MRGKGRAYLSNNKPFRDHTTHSGTLYVYTKRHPNQGLTYSCSLTCLTGSFMYMQHPFGQMVGHSARLISPNLSPNLVKCMVFYWYVSHQFTSNIELTVYMRPAKPQVSYFDETPVWRVKNEGSQVFGYWKKAVVPLVQNSNFQVSFCIYYSNG